MTTLQIVHWPHSALSTVAEEVTVFDDDLRATVAAMHQTMKDADGIGLAANQVNILKRIVVINIGDDWFKTTLINPKIISSSGTIIFEEGCLSFPNLVIPVSRPNKITISAQDEYGKSFTLEAESLVAICIQHEIDHLNGIVFINRGIINS